MVESIYPSKIALSSMLNITQIYCIYEFISCLFLGIPIKVWDPFLSTYRLWLALFNKTFTSAYFFSTFANLLFLGDRSWLSFHWFSFGRLPMRGTSSTSWTHKSSSTTPTATGGSYTSCTNTSCSTTTPTFCTTPCSFVLFLSLPTGTFLLVAC